MQPPLTGLWVEYPVPHSIQAGFSFGLSCDQAGGVSPDQMHAQVMLIIIHALESFLKMDMVSS
jgi:hypothetical protein